jgi:hypothetical protein
VDADVYRNGRRVGRLSGVRVDQPYDQGTWTGAGDPGFEAEFRAVQARLGPSALGMIPVTFRTPDGLVSAPARSMIRPAPEPEPYFRFGSPGDVTTPPSPPL